jgi:DNA modification methylase
MNYQNAPSRKTSKTGEQLRLGLRIDQPVRDTHDTRQALIDALASNLDFHGQNDYHAAHKLHSFPAKFPPQLPRLFIEALTQPGDVVLDPMMGSGTTLLEAYLANRQAVGFDIDPLALQIATVKTMPLDEHLIAQQSSEVIQRAKLRLKRIAKRAPCRNGHDEDTQSFIDYWFMDSTRCELIALAESIKQVEDESIRAFLELALSAIIITKSGGVSLALDLAHTRPHKAKCVIDSAGQVLLGQDASTVKHRALIKTLRPAMDEFHKRVQINLRGLVELDTDRIAPKINSGNSQYLPLQDASVDLIVTSPPYASNAIDYMRAHKFSLVWLGYSINALGELRNDYIGGETVSGFSFINLPTDVKHVVDSIATLDAKRGAALHRYYSEMTRSLGEMYRVLKQGKAAVLVVGNSILRNTDTQVPECLASIGRMAGFDVVKIGVRNLDRNRRMLPADHKPDLDSQIQQRMHQEYVIGFYKR